MRALLLSLSATVVLGACATTATPDAPPPLTPLSRYSLRVEPGLDRIALAVHETGAAVQDGVQAVLGTGDAGAAGIGEVRQNAVAALVYGN